MIHTKLGADYILSQLNITEDVLAIFPYGSHNYNTATENSDYDFIIVGRGSVLASGSFKDNARSNEDRTIQGVMYSRSGFIDAINNYDIAALECLYLKEPILNKWKFKIQKWDDKEFAKKIIQKISNSWHHADFAAIDGRKDQAKKGIFHALRILDFALQIKTYQQINFDCSDLWTSLSIIPNDLFDTRSFIPLRDNLMKKLRNNG